MIDDFLVHCTVLPGTTSSGSYHSFELAIQPPSISLGTLECIAPRLLSLRPSDVVTLGSSVTHPARPIPFPFFGGHTRQLLHVHFCYFSPQWDDPSYRNLTYLRLKSEPSVSQMLNIPKRMPESRPLTSTLRAARSDSEHPLPSLSFANFLLQKNHPKISFHSWTGSI